jgi:hypothetical protein
MWLDSLYEDEVDSSSSARLVLLECFGRAPAHVDLKLVMQRTGDDDWLAILDTLVQRWSYRFKNRDVLSIYETICSALLDQCHWPLQVVAYCLFPYLCY